MRVSKAALLSGAAIKHPPAEAVPERSWIPRCICKQGDTFMVRYDGARTFFSLNNREIATREGIWGVGIENNRPFWTMPSP